MNDSHIKQPDDVVCNFCVSPALTCPCMYVFYVKLWCEWERRKWMQWCVWALQQCTFTSTSNTVCVMSGDSCTLTWRSMSPTNQSNISQGSPTTTVPKNNIPKKIIKVCYLSNNSNLGKNFKLVGCEEGWTVKVCSTLLYSTLCWILLCSILYCSPPYFLVGAIICCTILCSSILYVPYSMLETARHRTPLHSSLYCTTYIFHLVLLSTVLYCII